MGALLLRLRTWWETADRTSRVVTIFGTAFLALLLGGVYFFASKPKMTLAYGGLSPAEVGSVVSEIQKMGVSVESDVAGNVYVPSAKVSEVRAKVAASGRGPSSGHMGQEDMSKLTAMTTPAVERERLKAILEGELATSIESMEGVSSARVHLTLGERTAFATDRQPASAAVYLQSGANGGVGFDEARSIATLVSRSVPGLQLDNVFVTDNTGRTLFDGTNVNGTSSRAAEKIAAEVAESQRRERDLQATFDATFGRGNTTVKVNLTMDYDQKNSKIHKESRSGKDPLSTDSFEENVDGGAAAASAGNTAGGGANTGGQPSQPPATSDTNKGGGYSGKGDKSVYPMTTRDDVIEEAAGEITALSVAVLVNEGKADPAAVKGFLDSYLAAIPGAKSEVTEVKFDQTQAEDAKKSVAAAASRAQMQQIFSLLPVIALFVVGFLVMKGLAKAAKSQNVLVTALPGGGMVQGSLPAPTHAMAAGSGRAPSQALARHEDPLGVAEEEESPEIRAIRERINVPLEQIKRMAEERPEAVAMLIKSWLLEERR